MDLVFPLIKKMPTLCLNVRNFSPCTYTKQFLMSQQWQGLLWFAGVSCTECFSPRSVFKSVLMTNPINRAHSCPKTHHHWQFNRHRETSSWSAFISAQFHIPLIQWNPIMFALIARRNARDRTFHSKPRIPGQHPWPSNPLPAEVKERYIRQGSSLLSFIQPVQLLETPKLLLLLNLHGWSAPAKATALSSSYFQQNHSIPPQGTALSSLHCSTSIMTITCPNWHPSLFG